MPLFMGSAGIATPANYYFLFYSNYISIMLSISPFIPLTIDILNIILYDYYFGNTVLSSNHDIFNVIIYNY